MLFEVLVFILVSEWRFCFFFKNKKGRVWCFLAEPNLKSKSYHFWGCGSDWKLTWYSYLEKDKSQLTFSTNSMQLITHSSVHVTSFNTVLRRRLVGSCGDDNTSDSHVASLDLKSSQLPAHCCSSSHVAAVPEELFAKLTCCSVDKFLYVIWKKLNQHLSDI